MERVHNLQQAHRQELHSAGRGKVNKNILYKIEKYFSRALIGKVSVSSPILLRYKCVCTNDMSMGANRVQGEIFLYLYSGEIT